MKALSVRQPYATMIVLGVKRAEIRSKVTRYRGEFLIHASKTRDAFVQSECANALLKKTIPRKAGIKDSAGFAFGKIVGAAVLCDCILVTEENIGEIVALYAPQCDVFPGQYAWILKDARPVRHVAARGALGLWEYTPSEES